MTVTANASGSGYQNYGPTATISITPTGSDVYLITSAAIGTASERVSGVTYNGQAMTRIRADTVAGSTSLVSYIYGIALGNVSGAAGTVQWNFTTSDVTANVYAESYNGVDQATPISAQAGNTNSFGTSGTTLGIAVPANGMGFAHAAVGQKNLALTISASQTRIADSSATSNIIYSSVASTVAPSATTVSTSWTDGQQYPMARSAIALNASAGGGGVTAAVLSGSVVAQATVTGALVGTATAAALAGTVAAVVTATGALAGSASFTFDVMINNANSLYKNQAVVWSWHQAGRIGQASTSVTYGTGTINASGLVTATGLPAGAGFGLVAVRNTSAADDAVFYQAGTAT